MPVTQTGFVYYQDDVTHSVFRIVYPTVDDSELNDPQWTTLALDSSRVAVLSKVAKGTTPAYAATPLTTAAQAIANVAAKVPAVITANQAVNAAQAKDRTAGLTTPSAATVNAQSIAAAALSAAQAAATLAAAAVGATAATITAAAQTAAAQASVVKTPTAV